MHGERRKEGEGARKEKGTVTRGKVYLGLKGREKRLSCRILQELKTWGTFPAHGMKSYTEGDREQAKSSPSRNSEKLQTRRLRTNKKTDDSTRRTSTP